MIFKHLRPHETPEGIHLSEKSVQEATHMQQRKAQKILFFRFKSAKYTLLTFPILNLFEQCRRGANFYFLVREAAKKVLFLDPSPHLRTGFLYLSRFHQTIHINFINAYWKLLQTIQCDVM